MRTASLIPLALAISIATGCLKPSPELVRLPEPLPQALLIESVDVLDVERGSLIRNRDVLVSNGVIEAIVAVGAAAPPEGTQRIDGRDATLIPGLIDSHGHTGNSPEPAWTLALPDPAAYLRAYLYCGVTTVLDPADLSSQAFERRRALETGELLGPRVFAAGPVLTARGGHPVAMVDALAPWWIRWYLKPRIARQVATAEEARAAVADVQALGADIVKIAIDRIPEEAPRLSAELAASVVDEAKRRGLRVIAHVGNTQDALDAGRAGVSAWVHGVYKERIADDRIAELAEFGIPMVPTTEVFASYARLGEGPREPTPLEVETAAADVLAAFDDPPVEDERFAPFRVFIERLREQRPHWPDNVRRLHEAGMVILAGSDAQPGVFPGASLHRELHQLAAAGLTPAEVLRAATLHAARFITGSDDPEFGVVAEGKRADLLLVEGNPTSDIASVSRIRAVIQGGVPVIRTPTPSG